MLQCTPQAAAALDEVRRRNDVPDGFGVRLFAARSSQGDVGLGIDFAEVPAEGDEVAQQHGTTIMVAPEISDQLAELTLDVAPDPLADGHEAPQLVLRPTDEG